MAEVLAGTVFVVAVIWVGWRFLKPGRDDSDDDSGPGGPPIIDISG